jgi:hypothetical protein
MSLFSQSPLRRLLAYSFVVLGQFPVNGHGFSILKVGLIYLGLGLGFLTAVWFLVLKIDTVCT